MSVSDVAAMLVAALNAIAGSVVTVSVCAAPAVPLWPALVYGMSVNVVDVLAVRPVILVVNVPEDIFTVVDP